MIYNYLYGGTQEVNITINGAVGETVTLTPTKPILTPFTVKLTNGTATLKVSKDTYTFVGSISKTALAEIKYDVKEGGIYNMWGNYKPLYWYGNDCVAWNHYTINAYASSYHDSYENENEAPGHYYAQIKAAGDQDSYSDCHLCFATKNKVDLSNYSKIKFDVKISAITLSPAKKGIRLGYSSQNSFGDSSSIESNVSGYYSASSLNGIYEVSSPGGSQYIVVTSYCDLSGVVSSQTSIARMYACWLE